MSKEKSRKKCCSSSSSSSISTKSCESPRPCNEDKCSSCCANDLCSFGKNSINFTLMIDQLIATGEYLMGKEDFSKSIKSRNINVKQQALSRQKQKQKQNKPLSRPIPDAPDVDDVDEVDELGELDLVLVLVDITGIPKDDIEDYVNLVYDKSQLFVGHIYNIADIPYADDDSITDIISNGDFPLTSVEIRLSAISFIYSQEPDIKLIGNPLNPITFDEVTTIVSYLNTRINCLNIPCCVKERIVDAINNNINKYILPQNENSLNLLNKQQFISFCDENIINIIPDCGPIYVANVVLNLSQIEEIDQETDINYNDPQKINEITTRINSLNLIITIPRTAQFYLQSYMSTKCCRSGSCKGGDKYLSTQQACAFVFDRFCIVDVPLPLLDFIFNDWNGRLD